MSQSSMIAIAIAAPGGPEMLRPVRLPIPRPERHELLIRVAAAGLNGADLGQRRGNYAPPPEASPLPGLEVGGEIAEIGADVRGWSVGDQVVALTNGGGYAEYVAIPAGQVLPLPRDWTMVSGAALPETFFTIEQTLVMRAGLVPGMVVLIHGAAGGIGGTAIQLSRIYGTVPIAVVSSAEKAAYVQKLGAAHVIDRSREDFVARTQELTGGRGADRVLDVIAGDMLQANIAASARGGHIVLLSTQAGAKAEINAAALMMKQLTISGSTLRPQSTATKAAIATRLREEAWPALSDGRIGRPRIRLLPLERAAAAHVALERRDNYGKLLLVTPWGESLLTTPLDGDNPIEFG
jgi:NADPH:quinone reductase